MKILDQYLYEKKIASQFRQYKTNNWLLNEELYNGVVMPSLLTKANLHMPKLFDGVQTMSARIGEMPDIEYDTKPEGDENAADIMKGLWDYDVRMHDLHSLSDFSKIEAALYGRAIFKFIPDNESPHFELLDTLSFLISPLGINAATAPYVSQQFIYKTIEQLEEEADKMGYDKKAIKRLKILKSDVYNQYNNDANQRNLRLSYMGFPNSTQLGQSNVEITEHYTTIEGEKYILTIGADTEILRQIKLSDVGLKQWPFFSWGSFTRSVSFWVPSVADVLRDPNLATDVLTNQVIDNNTYTNFGMIFADSSSGIKQGSIIPRPLGVTPVQTSGKAVKDAVWQFTPPPIANGVNLISILDSSALQAAGLTPPSGAGGRMNASMLAQQMALLEERTRLMKQSFYSCFREMGQTYADFVSKRLTTPRDVKIFGQKQMTLNGVTRANFKDVKFISKTINPESSQQNKAIKQKAILELYQLFKDDPKVPGQTYLREKVAREFGMSPTDIDKLMSQEEEPQQQAQAQAQAQATPTPTQGQYTNGANPAVSEAQMIAQNNVPPSIQPITSPKQAINYK
jgi:uncharacterized protein (UPF0335 family)